MNTFQIHFSLIFLAGIVAAALMGAPSDGKYWMAFLLLAIVLEIVVYLVLKQGASYHKKQAAQLAGRNATTFTAARERALKILTESSPSVPALDGGIVWSTEHPLPGSVLELYARFGSMTLGDIVLGREFVRASRYRRGFIQIGSSQNSLEIVVRPNDEQVWEIEEGDPDDEFEQARGYPSIWHYICAANDQGLGP